MATYTENYEMTLPEREDAFNVQDYNENFETIDTLMAENETTVQEVNEKLGTPDEGETVFSLLKNSGRSIVKSIQYKTCELSYTENSITISIETVDPAKCFVIFERLSDSSTNHSSIEYILVASALQVTGSFGSSSYRASYGFWVIEFN